MRIDDFVVTLIQDDGTRRTFARNGDDPKVVVRDPAEAHRKLVTGAGRQGHAQRDGLSLDDQVTDTNDCAASCADLHRSGRAGAGRGSIRRSLLKPLAESWPTYSGDYTGKRYSSLAQINQTTVKNLGLAWLSRGFVEGSGPTGRGAGSQHGAWRRRSRTAAAATSRSSSVARAAATTTPEAQPASRGTILMVDGVLYATSPDNLWAVDARDGTILWQYYWKTRGGTHTGHRGVGMWHNYLFMETHDDYLAEDRCADGQGDLAHRAVPVRPAVLLVDGAGDHRRSRHRRHRQRPRRARLSAVVRSGDGQAAVDPLHRADERRRSRASTRGRASRPRVTAAPSRGCPASTIRRRTLYIFGTGNPTPAYTPAGRGVGVGLFTCSLVAVNVDTGKMAWYYQTSPRDMHDWDSAQTPILIDTHDRRPAAQARLDRARATAISSPSIA